MTELTNDKSRREIAEEASRWLARLTADYVTDEDRAAFAQWIDASPLHREEYEEVSATWLQIGEIHFDTSDERTDWRDRIAGIWEGLTLEPVRAWAGAAAAAAVIAAVSLYVVLMPSSPDSYRTAVGQRLDVVLPDSSEVTLNTDSKLRIDYSSAARRVALTRGEALFSVERDLDRPFIVTAAGGEVRALGTAFNVRIGEGSASVAVVSGRVAVTVPIENTDGSEVLLTELSQGNDAVFGPGRGIVKSDSADIDRITAWLEGKFIFRNTPLDEVVAEINRYVRYDISLADPALSELRITGVFPTDRIPDLLFNLQKAAPVRVKRTDSGAFVIVSN